MSRAAHDLSESCEVLSFQHTEFMPVLSDERAFLLALDTESAMNVGR